MFILSLFVNYSPLIIYHHSMGSATTQPTSCSWTSNPPSLHVHENNQQWIQEEDVIIFPPTFFIDTSLNLAIKIFSIKYLHSLHGICHNLAHKLQFTLLPTSVHANNNSQQQVQW